MKNWRGNIPSKERSRGAYGYRVRLWKAELHILANELRKNITVVHFPPGTSK